MPNHNEVERAWEEGRRAMVSSLIANLNSMPRQLATKIPNKMDLSKLLYPNIRNQGCQKEPPQANFPNCYPLQPCANPQGPSFMFNSHGEDHRILQQRLQNGFVPYTFTNKQPPLSSSEVQEVFGRNLVCRSQEGLSSNTVQISTNGGMSKASSSKNALGVFPGSLLNDSISYLASMSSQTKGDFDIFNHNSSQQPKTPNRIPQPSNQHGARRSRPPGKESNNERLPMKLIQDNISFKYANQPEENTHRKRGSRSINLSSCRTPSDSSISPSESMTSVGSSTSSVDKSVTEVTRSPQTCQTSFTKDPYCNSYKRLTHISNNHLPLKKRKIVYIEEDHSEWFTDPSGGSNEQKKQTAVCASLEEVPGQGLSNEPADDLDHSLDKSKDYLKDKSAPKFFDHPSAFGEVPKTFLPMEQYRNSDYSDDDILIIDCDPPNFHTKNELLDNI